MQRQSFVIAERSSARAARGMGGLGEFRNFRLSPEWPAAGAVLSLASVQIIGQLGVLMFIAMTGALFALRLRFNLRQLVRFSPLLLLPVLAIASASWSDSPQRTMRAALQLFLTIAATIAICRTLRPDRFIIVLAVSFLLIGLTFAPSMLPSLIAHTALSVWWGSKNQVGTMSFYLFTLSVAVLADRTQVWWLRVGAVAAAGYGLIAVVAAQSGGALSSVAIFLFLFPPLALLAALKLPLRMTLGSLAAVAAMVMLLFLDTISAAISDFRVNVLNKDATLTGRTYLWEFAERLAASHPMLGTGYYAFWRQGNIDAEGLWRIGGAADRSGFNFHNVFVEMRVDLGQIGVWLLLLMCAVVLVVALIRQFAHPTVPLGYLIALVVVSYFRSYVEDGLVAPFSMVMMMWMATVLYAFPVKDGDPADTGARGKPMAGRPSGRQSRAGGWIGRTTGTRRSGGVDRRE